ncbi:MAG: sulfite exporter TauE/SafE family protein [Promethearchaeota archaeon]
MDLWLFIIIFIPLALLIGIATASISFTSWTLIVPLLYIGLGFEIYDALYFAILIDLFDSLILTIFYSKRNYIDYKLVIKSVIPMLFGAICGYFVLKNKFISNAGMFKGSLSYFILIISYFFFKNGKKELKKSKQNKGHKEQEENQKTEKKSEKIIAQEIKNSKFHFINHFQQFFHSHPNGEIRKRLKLRFENRFSGRFNKRLKTGDFTSLPDSTRYSVIFVGIFISGMLGGSFGIGSGMNFTLLFIFLLRMEHLKATGTGSFLMMILMVFAAIFYFPFVNFATILPNLLIAIVFSGIGTAIGAKYALKLKRYALNYLVSGTLLFIGIFALIQKIFL